MKKYSDKKLKKRPGKYSTYRSKPSAMLAGVDNSAFTKGNLTYRRYKNQVIISKTDAIFMDFFKIISHKGPFKTIKRLSPNSVPYYSERSPSRVYVDPKNISQFSDTSFKTFNYSDYEIGKYQNNFGKIF